MTGHIYLLASSHGQKSVFFFYTLLTTTHTCTDLFLMLLEPLSGDEGGVLRSVVLYEEMRTPVAAHLLQCRHQHLSNAE